MLGRIKLDPKVMVGKPVIKGPRLTVEYIIGLLSFSIQLPFQLSVHIISCYTGRER